jgi:hypothetical protein
VDLELKSPSDITTPSVSNNRTSFLSLSVEALLIDGSLIDSVPVCMKAGIKYQFHNNLDTIIYYTHMHTHRMKPGFYISEGTI